MDNTAKSAATYIGAGLALASVAAKVVRRTIVSPKPPVAKKKSHTVEIGAGLPSLQDPYFWMRDDEKKDEEILSHLRKENLYTERMTRGTKSLQKHLYDELLSHLKEDDVQVPYPHGPYVYYSKTEKGKSYRVYCRKRRSPGASTAAAGAEEEVVLDVNELAAPHKHYDLGSFAPCPDDHSLIAFTYDTTAYEDFTLAILDTKTGKLLQDQIYPVARSVCWGKGKDCVFYGTMDEAHRPYRVHKHTLGADSKQDECLFTEPNELYWVGFGRTLSGRWLLIEAGGKTESVTHVMDLDAAPGSRGATLECFSPMADDVLYDVTHAGDHFYVTTNLNGATNFKLMRVPVGAPSYSSGAWEEVLAHDPKRKLSHTYAFERHLVYEGREKGITCLHVAPLDSPTAMRKLTFDEQLYTVETGRNRVFQTGQLRVGYSSLVTPLTTLEVDLDSLERTVLQTKEVPLYDKSLYATKMVVATARDGTKVPISLVWRPDKTQAKDNFLYLHGYGSYEVCYDPEFNWRELPLLDRGVTVGIAHIRGGGEMGRQWYEDGKFLNKKNTFNDFIDCADFLVEQGYTSRSRLAIQGASAGGLLMGAVLNARPDLCKAVLAGVPFVDLMCTMSDPSIPLTVVEYKEWGNPATEEFNQYMQSYCPISNVARKPYPALLVTTGLNDSRVAYWEPMKWVAKLREHSTSDNQLLFKCQMDSGHGGSSGRYEYLKERAFMYSFLVTQLGLPEAANK